MKKWEKTLSSTTTIPKIEFLDKNIQGTSTNRIIQDLHKKKKEIKTKTLVISHHHNLDDFGDSSLYFLDIPIPMSRTRTIQS